MEAYREIVILGETSIFVSIGFSVKIQWAETSYSVSLSWFTKELGELSNKPYITFISMHMTLGIVPFSRLVLVCCTHLLNHRVTEYITLDACNFHFCFVSFDGIVLVCRNKLNK